MSSTDSTVPMKSELCNVELEESCGSNDFFQPQDDVEDTQDSRTNLRQEGEDDEGLSMAFLQGIPPSIRAEFIEVMDSLRAASDKCTRDIRQLEKRIHYREGKEWSEEESCT